MDDTGRMDSLDDLLVAIDYAWHDPASRPQIDALIRQHPDWAEEAAEFLAALESMDEPEDEERREAHDRLHNWLLSTGIDQALAEAARLAQATPTRSTELPDTGNASSGPQAAPDAVEGWLRFMHQRTGRKRTDLAQSVPHVTLQFLVLVSRYSRVVPWSARQTLADLVQEHLGIPSNESMGYLQDSVVSARAASRSQERNPPPAGFDQILERAGLSAEDIRYWHERARGD